MVSKWMTKIDLNLYLAAWPKSILENDQAFLELEYKNSREEKNWPGIFICKEKTMKNVHATQQVNNKTI